MNTSIASTPAAQKTYSFGFAQQMREADWSQFPSWYRAHCLLVPVMRSNSDTEPKFQTAA